MTSSRHVLPSNNDGASVISLSNKSGEVLPKKLARTDRERTR